jgi:predicted RNase H-like HicB family nuclease
LTGGAAQGRLQGTTTPDQIKTFQKLFENTIYILYDRYMTYYCSIEKERDEYIAQFPDMTNIVTCGFSHEEALAMAKEALDGCLEADIARKLGLSYQSYQRLENPRKANPTVKTLERTPVSMAGN